MAQQHLQKHFHIFLGCLPIENKKNEIENEFPIKRREETTLTCDISNKQKTKKNRSILGIHELNEWVSE